MKYLALLVGSLGIALRACQLEAPFFASLYQTRFDPKVCAEIVVLEALLVFSSYWISPMMGRRVNKAAIYLGGVTYPLYLIHQFAGYSIMNTYFTAVDRWLAICITALLMVAISSLIYVYFDFLIREKLRKIR